MNEALRIIGREGMGRLTLSRLSSGIGVSEGAIYRHFDSKTAIIKEILNDLFFRVSNRMLEEIHQDKPVNDKLRDLIKQLYAMFEEQPAYVSLLFSEEYFFANQEIFYLMHTIVSSMQLYIRQILEQGKERHEIRSNLDIQDLSLLIMGSLRITVINWRLKRNHSELTIAGTRLLNSLLEMTAA